MNERRGEMPVPKNARQSRCRSCGAAIWWTTTDKHKPVPLSAATVRVNAAGERFALTHFADCPHAASHRRGPAPAGEAMPVTEAIAQLAASGQTAVIEWAEGEARPELIVVPRDEFVLARELHERQIARIQHRNGA